MSYVALERVSKSYVHGDGRGRRRTPALQDVSLAVSKSSFVALFGPNGCGKTTLLNLAAGLTAPDSGRALIGGQDPSETKVGYLCQDYRSSLFPWRRVVDNVALPLELAGVGRQARRSRAEAFITDMGLSLPLRAFPYELSGGQQQMVAICRALVLNPGLLIMDEPFSALDYQTRLSMQETLLRLWCRMRPTVLFVSHEIEEAIYLADRLIVLGGRPGCVIGDLKVTLPRPRRRSFVASEEFTSLRMAAVELFERAVAQ